MAEEKQIQNKLSRVIGNSMRYLDSITNDHINDFNYIPESVQPYINQYIREGRQTFDMLSNALNDFDKSSDEYIAVQKEMETIARTFMGVRGQIDKYKNGINDFKSTLGEMNEGTQDSNYYLNSAVFGNQWDNMAIDEDGMFNFEIKYGAKPSEKSIFKLDDISDVRNGSSPIITEPWMGKKYVFDLAERIKKTKKFRNKRLEKKWRTYLNM